MVKFIPYTQSLVKKARENRKNPTCAEAKIWYEVLKNKHFFGYKFQRQKPLLNYIVDFYCTDLSLVIEIDGDSHAMQDKYDKIRTNDLNQCGIKVVRYFNNEVMCNIEGVYENLERLVFKLRKTHPGPPLSGRELKTKEKNMDLTAGVDEAGRGPLAGRH